MKDYRFYLQATDKNGTATGTAKDLEHAYAGLHYISCEGLEDIGKPKNIYTEDYAEADGPRVYHPADSNLALTREATEIKLSLLFIGATRRDTYNSFRAFASGSRLYYWDNARNKKVWIYLEKEVKIEEDTLPADGYIRAEFEFTNIWGVGKKCNDNGVLV